MIKRKNKPGCLENIFEAIMGLFSYVLEKLFGRARLVIFVGDRPAVEIKVENRTITAEVKSIVLAAELGLTEFLRSLENRGSDPFPYAISKLKQLGFKLKIKWGRLEVEI
jgi:hypothetical protein